MSDQHYARNHLNNVPITKKHAIVLQTVEKERMGYLLEFLKEIIYNKCDAFEKEYQKVIKHVAIDYLTNKQLELATKIDPCQVFQSFTVEDFMTV